MFFPFAVFFISLISCSSRTAEKTADPSISQASSKSPDAISTDLKYYNYFPFNFVYTMTLDLGGQSMETVVDTGSANLLVLGSPAYCTNCDNQYGYSSVYTPSSSSKELSDSWFMSFAPIGQATVQAYSDNVKFLGYKLSSFPFGLVTSETGIPNIIGLGFSKVSKPSDNPQKPFFDSLVENYKFKNQFSIVLCGTKKGSKLTLGGYDSKLGDNLSKVQWTPVPQKIWFTVSLKSMYIPSASSSSSTSQWEWNPSSTTDSVIVDSGTNPIVIPSSQIASLVTVLKNYASTNNISIPSSFWPVNKSEGGYATISNEDIAKFPDIKFDFESFGGSGETFTLSISPSIYFQQRPDTKQWYLAIEGGFGPYILGTAFMENFLVLHDKGDLSNNDTDTTAKVGFYSTSGFCE